MHKRKIDQITTMSISRTESKHKNNIECLPVPAPEVVIVEIGHWFSVDLCVPLIIVHSVHFGGTS